MDRAIGFEPGTSYLVRICCRSSDVPSRACSPRHRLREPASWCRAPPAHDARRVRSRWTGLSGKTTTEENKGNEGRNIPRSHQLRCLLCGLAVQVDQEAGCSRPDVNSRQRRHSHPPARSRKAPISGASRPHRRYSRWRRATPGKPARHLIDALSSRSALALYRSVAVSRASSVPAATNRPSTMSLSPAPF